MMKNMILTWAKKWEVKYSIFIDAKQVRKTVIDFLNHLKSSAVKEAVDDAIGNYSVGGAA